MADKLLESGRMGRAVKTYLMLIGMATRRETTTYSHIASQTGNIASQAVGGLCLDPIAVYCRTNGFPSLTSIVVNKNTGEPGGSYVSVHSVYRDREAVYDFDWLDYAPPTIEDLGAIWPEKSE